MPIDETVPRHVWASLDVKWWGIEYHTHPLAMELFWFDLDLVKMCNSSILYCLESHTWQQVQPRKYYCLQWLFRNSHSPQSHSYNQKWLFPYHLGEAPHGNKIQDYHWPLSNLCETCVLEVQFVPHSFVVSNDFVYIDHSAFCHTILPGIHIT